MQSEFSQELIQRQQLNVLPNSNSDKIFDHDGKGNKKKYIGIIILLSLILGISACIVLSTNHKGTVVPKWNVNTKISFSSTDLICVQQVSQYGKQCTQIEAQTTVITTDVNEKTSNHIILLNALKAQQQNSMMSSDDLLKQEATFNYKIPTNENTQVNKEDYQQLQEVPMILFTTDNETGEVIQVNIPSDIQELYIQTLITNILHLGPNTQEILIENNEIKNIYQIGKLQFKPKRNVNEYFNGEVEITKQVSKDDRLNGDDIHSFFDSFEQTQTTLFNRNNQISESHIKISTSIDASLKSQEVQYPQMEQIIQVSGQSDLVQLSEEKEEKDVVGVLLQISGNKQWQLYTVATLQDRLFKNQTQNNLQENRRLLKKKSKSTSSCNTQELNVDSDETIAEFDFRNKEIGIQAKVKGSGTDENFDSSIKVCLSVDNICVHTLVNESGDYTGQQIDIKEYQLNNIHTKDLWNELFHVQWTIFGFKAEVGTQFVYGFGFDQEAQSTKSTKGFTDVLFGAILVNTYAESNVPGFIGIRAGIVAEIFKGDITSQFVFQYDSKSKEILLNESSYKLIASLEALQIQAYAQWTSLSLLKKQEWNTIFQATLGLKKLRRDKELYSYEATCNNS